MTYCAICEQPGFAGDDLGHDCHPIGGTMSNYRAYYRFLDSEENDHGYQTDDRYEAIAYGRRFHLAVVEHVIPDPEVIEDYREDDDAPGEAVDRDMLDGAFRLLWGIRMEDPVQNGHINIDDYITVVDVAEALGCDVPDLDLESED